MKHIKCIIPVVLILMLITPDLKGQEVEVTAQIKPRYEMRHGFGSLFPDGGQAANFVSQRSRLSFNYSDERFRVGFSAQHIGVWGETGTMRMSDVNGASVHEAWGEMIINPKVSLKVGRQVLSYDNQRILGAVDWAQQARSHDAVLLSIRPKEVCRIDVGFAYNALSQTNLRTYYGINNYKAMQFAHWHRDFGSLGTSILFMNTGFARIDTEDTLAGGRPKEKIAYNQTMGFNLNYNESGTSINGAFYYQTGKLAFDESGDNINESTIKMNAFYFTLDASYFLTSFIKAGAGFEYFSGNSMKESSEKVKTFVPWFGTNHKFNGWMDYFYVSDIPIVGLLDIFVPFSYTKGRFSATLTPHILSSTADIYALKGSSFEDYSKYLGTEIDLGFSYAIATNVTIQAGYSQMFATESMQVLKGGNHKNNNNWAWVMIDFKPTFFKSVKQ